MERQTENMRTGSIKKIPLMLKKDEQRRMLGPSWLFNAVNMFKIYLSHLIQNFRIYQSKRKKYFSSEIINSRVKTSD